LLRAEPAAQVRAGQHPVDDLKWNMFVFHVALGEVRVTDVKDIQAARDGICGRFV
jgi:hypothetical protein